MWGDLVNLLWIFYWLMTIAAMCTLCPMMLAESVRSETKKGRIGFALAAVGVLLLAAVWPIVLLAGIFIDRKVVE